MRKTHQMSLLLEAARDYQDGSMPLSMLIDKLEGTLKIFEDRAIKDQFFDALLALEEVYARMQDKSFDFKRNGRSVVDRTVERDNSQSRSSFGFFGVNASGDQRLFQ